MQGNEEIVLIGKYKDLNLGVRFDLNGKKPAEVAGILIQVSEMIEKHAFGLSGMKTEEIENIVDITGKGLGSVVKFLESKPQSKIKEALLKAVSKPELLPAAECYLIKQLLTKADVKFKIEPAKEKPATEKAGDFVGFIGKYQNWITIKKVGLEKVQDYEIAGILASVNNTIVNKAFELAGIDMDNTLVGAITKSKRKSYGNLTAALRELDGKLTGDKKQDTYLVCKVCEMLGYKPYASPEMLTEAYPDIKPPKVKGRKPKG